MDTAVINIKTDPEVKAGAQAVAARLGFSLSALINGYLNQLVKTKTVHFSLNEEEPSEYLLQAMREAEEERKRGKFFSFASADEALNFVNKIINESKKN